MGWVHRDMRICYVLVLSRSSLARGRQTWENLSGTLSVLMYSLLGHWGLPVGFGIASGIGIGAGSCRKSILAAATATAAVAAGIGMHDDADVDWRLYWQSSLNSSLNSSWDYLNLRWD